MLLTRFFAILAILLLPFSLAANVKFSDLTAATSVSGSDQVPMLQGGGNVRATVDKVFGMSAVGDTIYGGTSGARTVLSGNTTSTKKFLTQTGNGSASAAPSWGGVVGSDISALPGLTCWAISDRSSDLTTGTNKILFEFPFAITVTGVSAWVGTAPTGASVLIDINEAGTTILGNKLRIDDGETSSSTASTAATITDSAIAANALVSIDIDQVGSTTTGKYATVCMQYTR